MVLFVCTILFLQCGENKNGSQTGEQSNEGNVSWDETVASVSGTQVDLMMWQGDPLINDYIKDYVVPEVKKKFNIDLNVNSGQGNQIVSTLLTELEAGKKESAIDMMWINGETFYQLRQIDGLYGPFTDKLPNSQFINFDSPFIGIDFQQKVDGYECPWGNVQLAIIYNSEYVPTPPANLEELALWVKENPGKFTFSYDFTGMTLLKSWLISLADDPNELVGNFNQETYDRLSKKLWAYLDEIKPYLWKKGEAFPNTVAQMHQLFANGELYFTMSNNDSEVDNKVNQKLFPETSRAYVYESGTIQNSHFMGIAKNAKNKIGALTVINFLISPEAQLEKMKPDVWGDGTILAIDKLPIGLQDQFKNIPGRTYARKRETISTNALMEPAPEYMIKIFADFKTHVIE